MNFYEPMFYIGIHVIFMNLLNHTGKTWDQTKDLFTPSEFDIYRPTKP